MFGTSPTASNSLSLTALNGEKKEDKVEKKKGLYPARVVLTSASAHLHPAKLTPAYPGQAGINPVPINWGAGRE